MQIIRTCSGASNPYPSPSHKRNLPFFLGAIILVCFFSFSSLAQGASKPVLDSPRLSHLNTSDGVSQNTIYDLHIDSHGFLWIANEEGLNRYDGHRVIQIPGIQGEFLSNPVYDIYEDSRSNLWISSGTSGVLRLNPQTKESENIVSARYLDDPEWIQYAEYITEAEPGNIVIALNHQVDLYRYETDKVTTLFVLNEVDIARSVVVRTAYKNGDMLLVGTSRGLIAKNLLTGKINNLEFLPMELQNNLNSQNVKQLIEMPNGQLWIGTVKGLYQMSLGALKQFVISDWSAPLSSTIDSQENIWSLRFFDENSIYVGTERGLFKTDISASPLLFMFEPQQNTEDISDKSVKSIATDKNGNVWIGTQFNGAMFWSPKSTSFTSISNSINTKPENRLSHNNVLSLYQEDENTLWIGTTNGLNKINLNTKATEQFLVSNSEVTNYRQAYIEQILSINKNELWISTGAGLRIFNSMTKKIKDFTNFKPQQQQLFESYSYGLIQEGGSIVWSLSDAGLIKFDSLNWTAQLFTFDELGLNGNTLHMIIGYDIRTSSVLLSAAGSLVGFNTGSLKVSVLHSIKKEGASLSMWPSSWLRDSKNNFWVSYAGKALYQLNGDNFEQINEFNSAKALSTNLIYGLVLDSREHLWFSSHSGLHQFNPQNSDSFTYKYMQGVSSTEFNEGAFTTLSDGRLAYGSTKGVTLLDPIKVSSFYNKKHRAPVITQIELSSRELDLPYSTLNNSEIVLKHDDMGLVVHFSSLNFSIVDSDRFNYRLVSNNKVINFPGTVSNKIEISMIESGSHVLEISELGDTTDPSQTAKLYIRVEYAPFWSPFAISIYAVLVFSGLLFFVIRRNRIQAVLATANSQIRLYNNRLTSALKASNSDIWEWSSVSKIIHTSRLQNELGYVVDDNAVDGNAVDGNALDGKAFDDKAVDGNAVAFEKHLSLIHEVDRLQYLSAWRQFIRREDEQFDNTYRMKHANGDYLWFRDAGSISSPENEAITVTGTYTNVTENIAAKERLKLFGDAFKHTRDWVIIFGRNKQPLGANPSFYNAFGISEKTEFKPQLTHIMEQQAGMKRKFISKLATLKPGERWKAELEFVITDSKITTLTDVNAIASESDHRLIEYYLIIMTDITEQKEAQNSLIKIANYDLLTGLINRSLLIEKLKSAILYAKRHSTNLSLVFIDLDRFKPINDTFGHAAGDKVIVEIAQRIKHKLRDNDIVSRLGGDEFVVVLEETQDRQSVNKVVQDLLKLLEQPIYLGSYSVSVSASAGIAMYPVDATDAESLLRNADVAMYSAKEAGKNGYQHFAPAMNEKVQQAMLLQNKLKFAVTSNEFENYYQPIVDTKNKKTAGFEMLMRWQNDNQFISPVTFIPIAEQIGLIVEMTIQAIERGLVDVAKWYEQGFDGYMAINLSAKQFSTRPDFEKILQLLKDYSLPTSCLRFEITEGLLVDNNHYTLDYMHEMRALGFKISLDDFGTGYSSLRYLKDFPIDVLKIDKSFVDDIGIDKGTESIIESTLIMTKMLNMDTVAEGIETRQQVDYFSKTDCHLLQGFYFCKPVSHDQCFKLLQKDWSYKFSSQ
jgi:diguanylate cyclase (GGDEF)-like protein